MWIMMNDSMLSIVEDKGNNKRMIVRARIRGDIEKVFPDYLVYEDIGTDYKFRAFIDRIEVAKTIGMRVFDIDYTNFKNSVLDDERHDTYSEIWLVMLDWQEKLYGMVTKWGDYFMKKYGSDNVSVKTNSNFYQEYITSLVDNRDTLDYHYEDNEDFLVDDEREKELV